MLILLALAKLQQSREQYISYKTIDQDFRELLIDFGPLRKRYQPELPFYHLQNDDLWKIKGNTPDDNNHLDSISRPERKYIGLDAAHIKWFQAEGPDNVNNGLLLCVLHHKLFDMGLITIDDSFDLRISEKTHGTDFFDSTVLQFNGQRLRNPIRKSYYPKNEYLNWHLSEVFHGPMREK